MLLQQLPRMQREAGVGREPADVHPVVQLLPPRMVRLLATVVGAILIFNHPHAQPGALARDHRQSLILENAEVEGVKTLQQVGVQDRGSPSADVADVVCLVREAHALLLAARERPQAPVDVRLGRVLLQLLRGLHGGVAQPQDHHRLALERLARLREILVPRQELVAVDPRPGVPRLPQARGHHHRAAPDLAAVGPRRRGRVVAVDNRAQGKREDEAWTAIGSADARHRGVVPDLRRLLL
mmetsp:Transcript_30557/g.87281  ORF Transcript_30557/g.87281 Transcript_30557/m.87281 type:complete len:240 (+) Transcript_30557:998-1717(+)